MLKARHVLVPRRPASEWTQSLAESLPRAGASTPSKIALLGITVPTDSDKGCIHWREEFSRSSLGRISQRFWLRGRFTRDLWPHVRAVDIKTAATLVVVRDAKGQGLRLDAAMELQLWSCEFTVAVKIGRIGRDVQIRNIRVDTHIIGLLTCWCIVVCHAIVVPNASCLAQSK